MLQTIMPRLLLLAVFLLCLAPGLWGQTLFEPGKHDYVWLFGYDNVSSLDWLGGSRIDFNTEPPTVTHDDRSMDFNSMTDASICDRDGHLQLYTNGYSVCNFLHDTIEGGAVLNNDPTAPQDNLAQGALILPLPGTDSIYYIIHEPSTFAPVTGAFDLPFSCRYTAVDMRKNSGHGKVTTLGALLAVDTFCFGKLTATRHANGRDWWILAPAFNEGKYYRFFLHPGGISVLPPQTLGLPPFSNTGQAVFSPDGAHYLRINAPGIIGQWIDLYDFDRCTGTLSNYHQLLITPGNAGGAAFSPNSRFLYLSRGDRLFQYDLTAPDLEDSETLIGEYDGFMSPAPTYFFHMQLAPNGKIYMNGATNANCFHVIHQPDLPGTDCQFVQHDLFIPTLYTWTMVNFPNFRLGPLDGSSCDTLGIDNPPATAVPEPEASRTNWSIFPNPAISYFTIVAENLPARPVAVEVYDLGGRLVWQQPWPGDAMRVRVSTATWPPGAYRVRIFGTEGWIGNKTVVVVPG